MKCIETERNLLFFMLEILPMPCQIQVLLDVFVEGSIMALAGLKRLAHRPMKAL